MGLGAVALDRGSGIGGGGGGSFVQKRIKNCVFVLLFGACMAVPYMTCIKMRPTL